MLDRDLVLYVINKYYAGYRERYEDDLISYGLCAYYEAEQIYDPAKTSKNFKYFATCIIRRGIYQFVRDRIHKIDKHIVYTDEDEKLARHLIQSEYDITKIDLKDSISKLPSDMKKIIFYHYYLGYPLYEIRKMLGYAPLTITRKHKKALEFLKGDLQYDKI